MRPCSTAAAAAAIAFVTSICAGGAAAAAAHLSGQIANGAASASGSDGAGAGAAGLASSLVKLRRTDSAGALPSRIELTSAKNEFESAQVVLTGPMTGVTVTVGAFARRGGDRNGTEPAGGAAGGAAAPRSAVFAARYVNVSTPSGCMGEVGMWPDPLVPDVDAHVAEKRNAFPLDVADGETQSVWLEVFVPAGAAAGTHTSTVAVAHASGSITLTLDVRVLEFALPSTPSMRSVFGFGGGARLAKAHKLRDPTDAEAEALVRMYIVSAAAHRVTLADWIGSNGSDPAVAAAANTSGAFAQWAAKHGDLYDGFDAPGPGGAPSLLGARLTAAQLPVPFCSLRANRSGFVSNCSGEAVGDQIGFWRRLASAWRTRGWAGLLYDYTIDEPNAFAPSAKPVAWHVVRERVGWLREADRGLRSLVTTELNEAQAGGVQELIDLWVPIINDINPKLVPPSKKEKASPLPSSPGSPSLPSSVSSMSLSSSSTSSLSSRQRHTDGGWELCTAPATRCNGSGPSPPPGCAARDTRPLYDPVVKATGASVWLYQACPSYGCGPTSTCAKASPCDVGWPSYAVDHPGAVNRAMEWASYIERASGELYYSTTSTFKGGPDGAFGWGEGQFYGGVGDGYLFYPGVASSRVSWSIGGKTDIPIESVRFKHVRDGFEDNEWLRVLEAKRGRDAVVEIIKPFMRSGWQFATDPETLLRVRLAVGAAIESAAP